jgi:predicted Na+-dependent transporter
MAADKDELDKTVRAIQNDELAKLGLLVGMVGTISVGMVIFLGLFSPDSFTAERLAYYVSQMRSYINPMLAIVVAIQVILGLSLLMLDIRRNSGNWQVVLNALVPIAIIFSLIGFADGLLAQPLSGSVQEGLLYYSALTFCIASPQMTFALRKLLSFKRLQREPSSVN